MNDREFHDHAATLAAATVADRFPNLRYGATAYEAFGEGVVLFFENAPSESMPRAFPKLREFLAIEEVGIRELGFGTAPDHRSWALLAESRRDLEYCRRLIHKAVHETVSRRSHADTP